MRGFSLTELILVVAVFATLTTLATVSLIRPQIYTKLDTAATSLVADIKQQQLQSMMGDTEGKPQAYPHGIHFTQNNYILFTNNTFDPVDPYNLTVDFGSSIEIVSPPSDLLFARRSGEIPSNISITLRHTGSGETKTVTVSKLGVATVN